MPPELGRQRRFQPWLVDLTGDDNDRQKNFRAACVRLLPGSTLVSRDDLIDFHLETLQKHNAGTTRLDAWLSLSRIEWRYNSLANGGKDAWQSTRKKGGGWIVPIPVGYGALSELHPPGRVCNARDPDTPFRFVESLYSAGEWIGTHRLRSPRQLLWYADSRPEQGLYRCRNDYQPPADIHA